MTDLRAMLSERVEGIREQYAFDLSALPEESAGLAILIESGGLAYVILASHGDEVLDVEVWSYLNETCVGARSWTTRPLPPD